MLPLAAFTIQVLIGKRLPRGGDWVVLAAITGSFVLSFIVFASALFGNAFAHEPYQWVVESWLRDAAFTGTGWTLPMGILVDNITAMMLLVVTGCCTLIFLFSTGYMHGHPRYSRFFGFLSLFAFSMLVLVLGNNLVALYVGWELVGVSSYLLIGFLHDQKTVPPDLNPGAASKKAFLTNRVGDLGFFLGILIIFLMTGKVQYDEVFGAIGGGAFDGTTWLLTLAGILLFMGAMGKSAQFPLHVWLPNAMAGPTPVSALIHAATMVAAGVYMVGRVYPLLTPDALLFIAYIGAITAFFAATIAVVMTDIKRVLAYSTISQLGFMIFGLGVGAFSAGLFHLMTHAVFKALLFLAAGSVIHAMHAAYHRTHREWDPETGAHDPQDMRNMGGLRKYMPVTFITMFVATLAISGVPFTSGFLSKDAILGGALAFGGYLHPQHFLIPLFGFAAAGMTAFYMFRLIFMTFFGENRTGAEEREALHESPLNMTIPLAVFAVFSLWIWYSWDPMSLFSYGWVAQFVEKPASVAMAALNLHPGDTYAAAAHQAHVPALILSLIVAGTGIFVAWRMHTRGTVSLEWWRERDTALYRVLANKYYVDEFYQKTVIALTYAVSRISAAFDRVVVDGIVNGVAGSMEWFSRVVSKVDSGGIDRLVDGIAGVSERFSRVVGKVDSSGVDGLVNGIANVTQSAGDRVRRVQTGRIQNYLVFAVLGAIVLILVAR